MRVEIAAPFMSRICRPRSKDRIEVASLALGAKKQDRDRVKRERERQREIERWRDGEIARYRERCGMLVKKSIVRHMGLLFRQLSKLLLQDHGILLTALKDFGIERAFRGWRCPFTLRDPEKE